MFSKTVDGESTDTTSNKLINVYDNYGSFKNIDQEVSGIDENSCLFVDDYKAPSAHTISSKDEFLARFDKLTQSILNFIDWNNVVVAGGLVNLALSTTPLTDLNSIDSDIDIFVYGVNEIQAQKTMNQIYESLKDIVPENKCVKTNMTITIILPKPFRHIQLVTKLYNSVGDLLNEFDLGCAKVAFDGKNVWTTIGGHFSLVNHTNIYMPQCDMVAYKARLVKYSQRGYRVMIPGFDKNMVSNYTYKTSSLNSGSNSLVKLLHYDKFGKKYSKVTPVNSYYMDDVTYLRQNLDSYNSVLFTRNDNIDATLENIKSCQDMILRSLHINSSTDKKKSVKGFKNHDIKTHPIYKVFKNVKLALIDRVEYNPEITETIFINGSIFKKSTIYKLVESAGYIENKEDIKNIFNKSSLDYVLNFDDIYYNKNVSDSIDNILNHHSCSIIKEELAGRDTLGRTYMQAAIMVNNKKLVKNLIDNNYDLLQRLDEGMTSVHYAIRENRHNIVKHMLNKLHKNGTANVKYYDNSGCNFSHYALMYSDLKMFKLVTEMLHVGLSDMSWSIKYNSQNRNEKGRPSKYICCAKLCMMYNKLDILKYILDMYTGFNDFRYIFVDSDMDAINTSNILRFAVRTSNYEALKTMCEFFNKYSIDICMDDTVSNATVTTGTLNKDIVTILMLEHYTKKSYPSMAKNVVGAITRLFNNREYTRLLSYVETWIPGIWTLDRYRDIHTHIKFNNVFGNKYVDTDSALKLFSAIVDNNFDAVDTLLSKLDYGLYIYSVVSNISPLTLCKDSPSKLLNVLNRMPEGMTNKKNTYYKYINDMLCVDYSILFNSDCIDILLGHPVHGKSVIDHINKYSRAIVNNIITQSVENGKNTYVNFGRYLQILSKYTTIDFERVSKDISYNDNTLPCTIDELVALDKVMKSIKEVCNPVLYNTCRAGATPPTKYIRLIKTCDDYDRLDDVYGDLHKSQNLLCTSAKLLGVNSSLREYLLNIYYVTNNMSNEFNIIEEWYGKNTIVFNSIVKKLGDLKLLAPTLQNTDFSGKEKCILEIMIKYKLSQSLKDINGNTVLHVIARNRPRVLFGPKYDPIVDQIDFHNAPNTFGKTPMDYVKTYINDTSKYTEDQLLENVRLFELFAKKLQK
jgi:ankyrin repeat protein